MLKVKDHPNLYRDEITGAIINASSDYDKYIKMRDARRAQNQELDQLKSEVSEIKQIMSAILEKLNAK
jgi:hypothetical protein